MTLTEFDQLAAADKHEIAMNANFLTDRYDGDLKVALYNTGDFYIELFYDPAENRLIKLEAFDKNERLVPYLAHVKFNLRH